MLGKVFWLLSGDWTVGQRMKAGRPVRRGWNHLEMTGWLRVRAGWQPPCLDVPDENK